MAEREKAPGDEALSLADEIQLALAHTPVSARDRLRVVFELDARLARIIAATSEPMLGQLRLAWWRDTISQPASDRPSGDAVLDAIGVHLSGRETGLAELVDGWEYLLEEPPLSQASAQRFADGRGAALVGALTQAAGSQNAAAITAAARCWSMADLAAKVSQEDERRLLVQLGLASDWSPTKLPREARGLGVLSALAMRSLKRGGRPLMEGRGAALVAMRAGLFGR